MADDTPRAAGSWTPLLWAPHFNQKVKLKWAITKKTPRFNLCTSVNIILQICVPFCPTSLEFLLKLLLISGVHFLFSVQWWGEYWHRAGSLQVHHRNTKHKWRFFWWRSVSNICSHRHIPSKNNSFIRDPFILPVKLFLLLSVFWRCYRCGWLGWRQTCLIPTSFIMFRQQNLNLSQANYSQANPTWVSSTFASTARKRCVFFLC